VNALSTAREPRSRRIPTHAPPRSRPVRRCPGAADHQDLVMTSHLPRRDPGQVDRVARENDMALGNELRCADQLRRNS
jgi:hypothetical protein